MIGSTLSHYTVEDLLGKGGMGIVYRDHDTMLNRTVAIKVLTNSAIGDAESRRLPFITGTTRRARPGYFRRFCNSVISEARERRGSGAPVDSDRMEPTIWPATSRSGPGMRPTAEGATFLVAHGTKPHIYSTMKMPSPRSSDAPALVSGA